MNTKKIKIILSESARSEAAEVVGKTLDDVTFGMRKVRQANRAGDGAALQKAFDELDALVDEIPDAAKKTKQNARKRVDRIKNANPEDIADVATKQAKNNQKSARNAKRTAEKLRAADDASGAASRGADDLDPNLVARSLADAGFTRQTAETAVNLGRGQRIPQNIQRFERGNPPAGGERYFWGGTPAEGIVTGAANKTFGPNVKILDIAEEVGLNVSDYKHYQSFMSAARRKKRAMQLGAPPVGSTGRRGWKAWLKTGNGKKWAKIVGLSAAAAGGLTGLYLLAKEMDTPDPRPPRPVPTPTPDGDTEGGEPGGPGPNAEECKSVKGLRRLLIDKAKEITGKSDNVAALTSLPREGENSWIRNTFRKLVSRRVSRSEKENIRSQITKKYGVELGCVLPKGEEDKAMTELEKAHAALVTALEKDNEKPSPFKGYGTGPSADTITKAIRKARAFGNKKLATDVVKARAEMQDLLEDLEDLVKDSSGAGQQPAASPTGGAAAGQGSEQEKANIVTQLKGLEKNQRNLSQIQSLTRKYLQLGGKMEDLKSAGITENLQEIVPVPGAGMSRRGTPQNPSNVGFLSRIAKTVKGAKSKRLRDTSNNVEKVDKKLLNLISQILKIDTDTKGNKIDLKKFNQVSIGRTKPRQEMAEGKQKMVKTLKDIALSVLKENKINKKTILQENYPKYKPDATELERLTRTGLQQPGRREKAKTVRDRLLTQVKKQTRGRMTSDDPLIKNVISLLGRTRDMVKQPAPQPAPAPKPQPAGDIASSVPTIDQARVAGKDLPEPKDREITSKSKGKKGGKSYVPNPMARASYDFQFQKHINKLLYAKKLPRPQWVKISRMNRKDSNKAKEMFRSITGARQTAERDAEMDRRANTPERQASRARSRERIVRRIKGLEKNQANLKKIQRLTRRFLRLGGEMNDLKVAGVINKIPQSMVAGSPE